MKKQILFAIILIIALKISAQDKREDRFSYSFAWAPTYYGPINPGFQLDNYIPFTFEANIYFNIIKRLTISTGIGYQGWFKTYNYMFNPTKYDPNESDKFRSNELRIPLQLNFYITKDSVKFKTYIKAEIINEFDFNKYILSLNKSILESIHQNDYSRSINIGLGKLCNITRKIILLSEISLGTYADSDFFKSYLIKIKLGIMI